MKAFIVAISLALAASSASAQCNPIGWVLVRQKIISVSERMCVYAKNGAELTIMVNGLCPISPC